MQLDVYKCLPASRMVKLDKTDWCWWIMATRRTHTCGWTRQLPQLFGQFQYTCTCECGLGPGLHHRFEGLPARCCTNADELKLVEHVGLHVQGLLGVTQSPERALYVSENC